MKKLFLTFFSVALFAASPVFATSASEATEAASYLIDDQQVEHLLAKSEDVSLGLDNVNLSSNFSAPTGTNQPNRVKASDEKFVPALLLNLFLGGLGIHRLYLGTKTITWVGYILTCGGIFGIVPLVDLIVVIVHNENLSSYVDNPKFFMWAK